MDTWLIAVLGVLGALVLILLVIPIISGMVYRCCTRTVQSAARLDGKTVIVTGASGGMSNLIIIYSFRYALAGQIVCRTLQKCGYDENNQVYLTTFRIFNRFHSIRH